MTIRRITLPIKNHSDAVFDMDLDLTSVQDATVAYYLDDKRFPEPELIQLLVRAVRPGDYVVDAGACTGFFSLLMAALGAHVLAIEPGTNNHPALYRNVEINQFDIDIRPVALGAETCVKDFVLTDDGGANSFTQPADRPTGRTVAMHVRRLRDFITATPKLIKMDIEGAEYDALEGWLPHIVRCPYIAVEYNLEALARSGHTGVELRALMRSYGYELFVLFADGMLPLFIPPAVSLGTTRQNTNVLFSSVEDIVAIWPELEI